MPARCRLWVLLCAGGWCHAAAPEDLLTRIRDHMREYVSQLPDYTCRVTIERSTRRSARAEFEPTDRLRLEVAYTSGDELYAWPGADKFEHSIDDLLPAHGMVSNGSYALHMRTLFLRSVARFGEPRTSAGRISLDFSVPALRSGYALSTASGSVPAGLEGTVWLAADSLDLERLEVRVDTPLAHTIETTIYARARIGDVAFVVPQTSELVLIDRDRMQLRNFSRFDEYRRFAGTATIHYDPAAAAPPNPTPRGPAPAAPPAGSQVTAALDAGIGTEAAIGDPFTATASDGARLSGRITDMRRVGKVWHVELSLDGAKGKTAALPLAAGVRMVWRRM